MSNTKYPAIDDEHYFDKIVKVYEDYKIPKSNLSAESYCKPKKFKLQPPQKFVASYINPKTPYKSLLIYHRIGAGKTCAAIQIAEVWKKQREIVFVLPASLQGNFRNELRSQCAGDAYITEKERKKLEKLKPTDREYNEIIKTSNKRIDKYYSIYSYNKFIENVKNNKISIDGKVLIIDEIQNMVSEAGSYYVNLYNFVHKSKDPRIILLSATPMFDKPVEFALTMNLLKLPVNLPIGNDFKRTFMNVTEHKNGRITIAAKNMDLFKSMITGFVSFFEGAPPQTFPTMKVKYVECVMSDFQYKAYKKVSKHEIKEPLQMDEDIVDVSELPNNFYIGTRYVSNIVFPNKKTGTAGISSLTNEKILKELEKYSCKFAKIMCSIRNSKGKIFIYSNFKQYAGIKSLTKILEAYGYTNYRKHGPGRKRFAIWSGDETVEVKDQIRSVFNSEENIYGKNLKIILGSPSIKEGVSLKAVRYVHVIEPYWNIARIDQVIGRASRFCSHINLPEEERNVKVYIYLATHPDIEMSVDKFIKKLSDSKNKLIKVFEKSIKEAAVDCRLNYNANKRSDDDFKCM